jgi:peroxiredoxin Q/BCP
MNRLKLLTGHQAPYFEGVTTEGIVLKLNDFKGKKLVLYFYPMDFTPDCTAQACSLRNGYSKLKQQGFEVIGISPDNVERHREFSEKYKLPFPLISDTDLTIQKAYGTAPQGGLWAATKRVTFVIDENGIITRIITHADTRNHAKQILEQTDYLTTPLFTRLMDKVLNRLSKLPK